MSRYPADRSPAPQPHHPITQLGTAMQDDFGAAQPASRGRDLDDLRDNRCAQAEE